MTGAVPGVWVTTQEWYEFVQAYGPYVDSDFANSTSFTGYGIVQTGPSMYYMAPGAVNKPVEVGWRFAAIYCNWLHNNKGSSRESFETGAYDVSTFGGDPGLFTDQREHSPGARYWLPTHAEWVKAAHFDPDRYGSGLPGYWLYPNSSDVAPVQGAPGVGQTSAGTTILRDVASYRDVQSPWGLWDVSGGVSEWTEGYEEALDVPLAWRIAEGTGYYGLPPVLVEQFDGIDAWFFRAPWASDFGIRIARAVPTPSGTCVVLLGSLAFLQRRRAHVEPT